MEVRNLFGGIFKNKTCLVTGHTGFKGSWLAFWLEKMGAKVIGYSLTSPTTPNHFELLNSKYISVIGDIRNKEVLQKTIIENKPDIVFHLAAQSIVRLSYVNPVETFETNVNGTLNVYEACRKSNSVKAIVNVTSDKCYNNNEWIWGYRENDPMGGHDPYSASKGCSELLTASYRKSFLNQTANNILLASARAGNVIGGGDWAIDRLIPDIVKAAAQNDRVFIRNPLATRPWQHVLEPLSGYLMLGWKLLEGKREYADGWNFGPDLGNNVTVIDVARKTKKIWDKIIFKVDENPAHHHEANLLMLDCSKASQILKWKSVWGLQFTLTKTIEWYKSFYETTVINTENDLNEYIHSAKEKEAEWTK